MEGDNEPILIKQKTLNKFKILIGKDTELSMLPDGKEFRVHYFDGYVRGEAIRMLLAHADVPFDDRRI